jgi:hypothetical protein
MALIDLKLENLKPKTLGSDTMKEIAYPRTNFKFQN